MCKILLDPGHGGKDSGAVGHGYLEKDINLESALLIGRRLTELGAEVDYTRTTDVDAGEVYQRGRMAKGYDYFLSIHCNAFSPTATGAELWCSASKRDAGVETRIREHFQKRFLWRKIASKDFATGREYRREVGQNGVFQEVYNFTDWYGVLRGCGSVGVPGGLLEMFFISNLSDLETFLAHKEELLEGIVRSICESYKLVYTPPGNAAPDSLTPITGKAQATAAQLWAYLRARNPAAPNYVQIYLEEGASENIRGDIAFAQSVVETGHWKFGGDVSADQNNFAGIGATGNGAPGNSFPTPREGIRAQIQHLKAYANTAPLSGNCVDPRFAYVQRGCAPYVEWLGIPDNPSGKGWAGGKDYGKMILGVLGEVLGGRPPETVPGVGEAEQVRRLREENLTLRAELSQRDARIALAGEKIRDAMEALG